MALWRRNGVAKKGRLGGKMTKSLGKMVGLLLALYVFDQIVATVMPLLCKSTECDLTGTCTRVSYNAANASTAVCTWRNGTGVGENITDVGLGGTFGTPLVFVENLFPIVGLLGAFEIILTGLKATKLL